jgi:hypothetical protein
MADNLSALAPPIWLSGLPFGPNGVSGIGNPGMTGAGTGGTATPFGMPGGPGLDLLTLLSQLNGGGGDSSVNPTSLLAAIGQGGLGASQLGQQYSVPGANAAGFGFAGQTAPAPGGSQQAGSQGAGGGAGSSNTSVDPFALTQKLLGLGSQAAKFFSQG